MRNYCSASLHPHGVVAMHMKESSNIKELLDSVDLTKFEPFSTFSAEKMKDIEKSANIVQLPPGKHIFDQGDMDSNSIFLLSGQIALVAIGHPAITIKAGSNEALQPVADYKPREVTALAHSRISIMNIETSLLEELIAHNKKEQKEGINNEELEELKLSESRIEWVLNSPLFFRLPTPHVQVLARRLEEITATTGAKIISEGDDCEYYYIITEGRCMISYQSTDGCEVKFAELSIGRGFGESALITNRKHSNTITMLEDGKLVRIPRNDFMSLMVTPYIKCVSYSQMLTMLDEGTTLIDVRTQQAYLNDNLRNSINLPLSLLWKTAPILDKGKAYIACCEDGTRSTIAAFIMAQHGLNARILEGGIESTSTAENKAAIEPAPETNNNHQD